MAETINIPFDINVATKILESRGCVVAIDNFQQIILALNPQIVLEFLRSSATQRTPNLVDEYNRELSRAIEDVLTYHPAGNLKEALAIYLTQVLATTSN